jgi:hypothetical protein
LTCIYRCVGWSPDLPSTRRRHGAVERTSLHDQGHDATPCDLWGQSRRIYSSNSAFPYSRPSPICFAARGSGTPSGGQGIRKIFSNALPGGPLFFVLPLGGASEYIFLIPGLQRGSLSIERTNKQVTVDYKETPSMALDAICLGISVWRRDIVHRFQFCSELCPVYPFGPFISFIVCGTQWTCSLRWSRTSVMVS